MKSSSECFLGNGRGYYVASPAVSSSSQTSFSSALFPAAAALHRISLSTCVGTQDSEQSLTSERTQTNPLSPSSKYNNHCIVSAKTQHVKNFLNQCTTKTLLLPPSASILNCAIKPSQLSHSLSKDQVSRFYLKSSMETSTSSPSEIKYLQGSPSPLAAQLFSYKKPNSLTPATSPTSHSSGTATKVRQSSRNTLSTSRRRLTDKISFSENTKLFNRPKIDFNSSGQGGNWQQQQQYFVIGKAVSALQNRREAEEIFITDASSESEFHGETQLNEEPRSTAHYPIIQDHLVKYAAVVAASSKCLRGPTILHTQPTNIMTPSVNTAAVAHSQTHAKKSSIAVSLQSQIITSSSTTVASSAGKNLSEKTNGSYLSCSSNSSCCYFENTQTTPIKSASLNSEQLVHQQRQQTIERIQAVLEAAAVVEKTKLQASQQQSLNFTGSSPIKKQSKSKEMTSNQAKTTFSPRMKKKEKKEKQIPCATVDLRDYSWTTTTTTSAVMATGKKVKKQQAQTVAVVNLSLPSSSNSNNCSLSSQNVVDNNDEQGNPSAITNGLAKVLVKMRSQLNNIRSQQQTWKAEKNQLHAQVSQLSTQLAAAMLQNSFLKSRTINDDSLTHQLTGSHN